MAIEEIARLRELTPDEVRRRLIALVRESGPAALEVLRPALQEAGLAVAALEALGELPTQESWDLLERFSHQSPAALRKAARRAQHRLRSRGFHPAPAAPRPQPSPAVDQACVSIFDRAGAQFMRLVRPAPLGMARCARFIVGPEGLLECSYILQSRADLDDILAEEDGRFGRELIEMGLAYVARRVREAVAHSRAAGRPLPRDYPEAARLLDDAPDDVLPADLAACAAQGTAPSPTEIAPLFRHRTMARWALAPERLRPYAQDWLRVLQYQPVRTEEGLANLGALQARGQITSRVIADLCDEATVRRLAGQLAEQARMLYALGEGELAGLALRCAGSLEEHPGPDNPFLRALVEESMELALHILREKEEEEASQGSWIRAGDASGSLWLPRPAAASQQDEGGEKPAPHLWLPGQ